MKYWVLTGILFCATPAVAATYYVAPAGVDSRTCATAQVLTTPRKTISAGTACLAAGDTLLVRGGSYNEIINNPAIAGTSWANKIRIAAYPGEIVWVSPTGDQPAYTLYLFGTQQYVEFDGINLDGSGVQYGAVKIEGWDATSGNPHHIRIQNAEILADVNSVPGPPFKNALLVAAQVNGIIGHNEFINLTVHRGHAYGFYINSSDNLVEHCRVYDLNGAGIHMSNSYYTGDDRNVVSNNIVHDILGDQPGFSTFMWGIINGSGAPSNNLYYNNVVYNIGGSTTGDAGIFILGGDGVRLWNNTVYGGKGIGISISQSSVTRTTVQNNISYGNALGNYTDAGTGTVQSNNLFGVNPLFVNAGGGNFQLQPGSPAINSGMTLAVVTTDILGVARPQGSAYDIGAYESGSSVLAPPSRPTNLRIVP